MIKIIKLRLRHLDNLRSYIYNLRGRVEFEKVNQKLYPETGYERQVMTLG